MMSPKASNTLEMKSRRQWREWLKKHHDSVSETWLLFNKRHTGVESIGYDAAIEEALCYGWVDSLVKRIDEARYARKFTPRRADSKWSTANRRRYESLAARGMLAAAGLQRAPTDRSGDAPCPSVAELPAYIEAGLKAIPKAWGSFEKLPPSHRRAYVGWIDSAKREETKKRRLEEAVRLLAAGRRLGLK